MNIIYFSGNGNTKHCVEFLSQKLRNGKIESIESENAIQMIKDSKEFVFAYPVHYSNIPFIVKDFIKKNTAIFAGTRIFLVATMGAFSGDGTGCAARLLKKYGAKITGGLHLRMPDAIGDVKMLKKSREQNKLIIKQTEDKIQKSAEMIKNGFLQQNAFDDVDKYCSTDKQIAILELIMNYYKRAVACVKAGAPLAQVTSLPVCEEIVRIKMIFKNEEMDKINEVGNHLETQISEIERLYSAR